MENLDKLIVFFLGAFILAIAYQFGAGNITGLAVNQDLTAPSITVTKVEALDSKANIKWQTDEDSTSYFNIDGQTASYEKSIKFGINLEKLTPGKEYEYTISACDTRNNCDQQTGKFTTLTTPKGIPKPITGSAVTDLSGVQSSLNSLLLLLIIGVASFILLNAGYQRMEKNSLLPASIRIGMMISKAENMLNEKRHEEASLVYAEIRQLFDGLNAKEKGKHQKKAIQIYSELLSHTQAKEANMLVDKYLEGKINDHELARLRELLET